MNKVIKGMTINVVMQHIKNVSAAYGTSKWPSATMPNKNLIQSLEQLYSCW